MNETNKGVKMTKTKNLKSLKIVKDSCGDRHYEDCDMLWLGSNCDCDKREAKVSFKMSELAVCHNESVGIYVKRRMARTNNKWEGTSFHCSQHCADTWKNN